ncbi:MAG: hypothetical protein PSV23_16295 [Brevundimonas sp.]|uniref:hypothetical protein n=1 Tax=Brevundimonas sp. TaxID=1871086 RepID=UPI002489015D|nr:hypothetical protein [Brevundimonas sp.]MDI1328352.1 hypothetical protein [Brevundimonas sp.]
MAYGADFATADAANAPLDAPLMIGADPVVWGGLLLGLAAAALIGWYFGQGSRSARTDAADSIWEEIDDAAKEAMKADGDSLPARASALVRTIERRLGKTLGMAGGAGKITKGLDKALKGEAADKPHAPHADHGHGGGHDEKPGHHEAAPASMGGVTVIVNSGQAEGHKPAGDPHGDHDAKKPLSVQERNDALRVAIGHFNDHWGLRRERVRELRAAHAELSTHGPKRPAAGKVSGTRAGH